MPVTLKVANHAARQWKANKVENANALLSKSCPKESRQNKELMQSSFPEETFVEREISPSDNGFVRALYYAYSNHHHLTIRPEDVWFAILTQLHFFINANAEELRSFFVAHEGQKELLVSTDGNRYSVNFGELAIQMTHQIEKNVIDPELRTWIMPAFTTTTKSDMVVASILMMGAMQKYFSYKMMLCCGIPSVTLLGEKSDYEVILTRLEKLAQLGKQPESFANLLRPIIRRFMATFDDPSSPETIDFWNKVAHHQSGGSGPTYLSGWLTAFCFWDSDGKMLYRDNLIEPVQLEVYGGSYAGLRLDGVLYHRLDTDKIPHGCVSVPVKIDDNGNQFDARMVAGSAGIQATSSGQMLAKPSRCRDMKNLFEGKPMDQEYENLEPPTEEPGMDSIQPISGWWMYETETIVEKEERDKKIKAKTEEFYSALRCAPGSTDWGRVHELGDELEGLGADEFCY